MEFKIGDYVVKNQKYHIKATEERKVYRVRSNIQDIGGTPCVFLEGVVGAYAADGLTKVNEQLAKCSVCKNNESVSFEHPCCSLAKVDGFVACPVLLGA